MSLHRGHRVLQDILANFFRNPTDIRSVDCELEPKSGHSMADDMPRWSNLICVNIDDFLSIDDFV